MSDIEETKAQVVKLLAENKRLRKALQRIVDLDDGDEPAFWKFHDAFHDAIEALK
ncbi:MAG: hypothetical protein WC100_05785 [Sterolibacterium sp.]